MPGHRWLAQISCIVPTSLHIVLHTTDNSSSIFRFMSTFVPLIEAQDGFFSQNIDKAVRLWWIQGSEERIVWNTVSMGASESEIINGAVRVSTGKKRKWGMCFLFTAGGESSTETESLSWLKTKAEPMTKINARLHKTPQLWTEKNLMGATTVSSDVDNKTKQSKTKKSS